MKVGIVGSREFLNLNQLRRESIKHLTGNDEIVSGGAKGADSFAQIVAKELGIPIHIYYPNYSKYGKPATFIRNTTIAEQSDVILAFFQKGRMYQGGTNDTIEKAKKLGKQIIAFEEEVEGKRV